MRILFVHNYYGSSAPSGENRVFEAEQALLKRHGHEVFEFVRNSDEIRLKGVFGIIQGACSTPWNYMAAHSIRQCVWRIQPDVVHVHNTFPLISPAIFHAIGSSAAKVLTLHNYRLFCPAAIPTRNGRACTDCIDGHSTLPALIHGCYRHSHIATLPLAASVALHRAIGTWTHKVDAFIALTDFQKDLMVKAGLPAKRVHVKPNFYPGNPTPIPWKVRGEYAVFAGRLSQEKGVETLVRAWALWGADAPELRIVGDGPLRGNLEQLAGRLSISFLGQLSSEAAQAQIAGAKLLILPSECFEGFPMVVREAFAFGTPAAVSNIGPLPVIVSNKENGVVFDPADPQSLVHVVRTTWNSPGLLETLSQGARLSFEGNYTEQANYLTLKRIYVQAIEENNKMGMR
ncbi:MAG: glycosyltransferase [Geobacter sp.]|nr:glycosyltransferase [Geobacter sp.]